MDAAVDSLDILTAYNRFCGKMVPDARGKTESIMISCPNPSHLDRNPSAWINTDNQTWFCAACNVGGDKYDIVAWGIGLPVPGYKTGANFVELRTKIAESQGYTVTRSSGVTTVAPPIPEHVPVPPEVEKQALATVTTLHAVEEEDPLAGMAEIHLDWRKLVQPGTFLEIWMRQTTVDDVPEEYHFWNGMLAIGMALGRDATLFDSRPVYGNLYICILGKSGMGKSKATYSLNRVLELALPYSASDPNSKGAMRVSSPASAEALIWSFKKEYKDPSTSKSTPPDLYPVRGIIDFNELSALVGRTNRQGNVLRPSLMEFYDVSDVVETVSRTHGSEKAFQPFASAITTSQPKALRDLLSEGDAASGFLNRWMFVGAMPKKRVAIGGTKVDVLPAVDSLRRIQAWASSVGEIQWSQGAHEDFTKLFDERLFPILISDESDLLSRIDLLAKKLVLLFTANAGHVTVQPETIALVDSMLDYILKCYGVPMSQIGGNVANDIREAVLESVVAIQKKSGKGPTMREITRRLAKRNYSAEALVRTVKTMVEAQDIEQFSTTGRGRPTTRYFTFGSVDAAELTYSSGIARPGPAPAAPAAPEPPGTHSGSFFGS